MTRYDAVVIGAGLGGLTAGAILARAGRKVLVIERGNSVGGAASSYKVGDLFVEGSLHLTSAPQDARDPKHAALKRAGALDAVQWVASGALYQVRGGPLDRPLLLPDDFAAARCTLIERFPRAERGLTQLCDEMQAIASGQPAKADDLSLTLAQKLDRLFGDDEPVKCAIAANLSYYHDDPATLSWIAFAAAQGSYLQSGGRFVQGGSQRLSSALARSILRARGEVQLRRVVSAIAIDASGAACGVTHTARDGSDPQTVEAACVIGNAAPAVLAELMPADAAARLSASYAEETPSISLFALTLGLAKPPREFGIDAYSTQLLPPWLTRLADYAQGTRLMAEEPADKMPPLSIVDYAAIDSGVPTPPYVLSVVGPDHVANWDGMAPDDYRARRGRWQDAIVATLEAHYPGLAAAVTHSAFNTALSVQQYLNAPGGAAYGFAPTPARCGRHAPHTVVPGLYLASAYAGLGGYSGVMQAAGACAEMILTERSA
uniref:Amine oxidase n=1 Tax=Rhodopseudomonas palustris (strain BisA53) TaxID=316055 RepID=Q07TC0_RHOP5